MKKTASTRQRGVWAGDFREATSIEQIVPVLLKTLAVGGPELGLLLASKDVRNGTWRICPPCRDGPDAQGIPESLHPASAPQGRSYGFENHSRTGMNP